MSGTKEGAKKMVKTIYARHGRDFFKKIGSIGGKQTDGMKGFAMDNERARRSGSKGGRISKRGYTLQYEKDGYRVFLCHHDGKLYRFEIEPDGRTALLGERCGD